MLIKALAVAATVAILMGSSGAIAKSETNARAAVAEARGKIEANEKSGMTGIAIDAQTRAREALARAEKAVKEDKENRAYFEAQAADALAGLAQTSAELEKLNAERNKLAVR